MDKPMSDAELVAYMRTSRINRMLTDTRNTDAELVEYMRTGRCRDPLWNVNDSDAPRKAVIFAVL